MKVLFFGLGGIGQRHLRNLRKIQPDIQIAAFRTKGRTFEIGNDLLPDYNSDIVSKYNISTFEKFEDAMKYEPDFAVVSNPTSLHVSTAKQLVMNKIPVFMEKPISDCVDGLGQLLQMSKEKKVPVMIGYMMRFHPCAIKLKEMVDEMRIGKIFSVHVLINSYMPGWHSYEKYNAFYAGMKSLGGGVVLTEIHELDLIYWYFGKPDRLWAVGGKLSNLNIDVEDTVGVLLEQKFLGHKFPVSLNISFVQKYPLRKMLIFGEHGKIEWDIIRSEIEVEDLTHNSRETYQDINYDRNSLFISEIRHFVECLSTTKDPITSLGKVIDGHLIALKIKESLNKDIVSSLDSLL